MTQPSPAHCFPFAVGVLMVSFSQPANEDNDRKWKIAFMLQRCSGPASRRDFLRIGSLALGGLTFADVLAAQAAHKQTNDNAVILFYCHGGASQLETYDLKPDAPTETRSVFKPISTNVPGISICELFPRQAKLADRFTLIRSLHHQVGIHSDGGITVLTGKVPRKLDPTSQSKSEHPDVGMIASRMRRMHPSGMPQYVSIPQAPYMTLPNYVGVENKAFVVGDPSFSGYRPPQTQLAGGVDGNRLHDRKALLGQFDTLRKSLDSSGQIEAMDRFRARAFEMMTSSRVAKAFDLRLEPSVIRERYGQHQWGQACLLARRLAESGVAVTTIFSNTPKSGQQFTNWDDHPGNAGRPGHFAKFFKARSPYYDEALAALIEDVYQRGLDKRIMIVVVGEFGRTPRLRKGPPNDSIGRDHWPQAYSALVSGGGMRMGQVIGATNSKGEHPTHRPLTPMDLLATMYHHLGIDPHQTLNDFTGRPVAILDSGKPIRELL